MTYAEGTRVARAREECAASVAEIASLIAPTLGPAGSDVLISGSFGEVSTTNDGATILRSVPIEHPAARIAADIALTQESSVGDGTTTAVVLAAAMLERCVPLIGTMGLRPVLDALAETEANVFEHIDSLERPLADGDLERIVSTTLSGKSGEAHAPLIARLLEESLPAPDAPVALIARSGTQMHASERIDGIMLDRMPVREDMPTSITKARIGLVSGAIEAKQAQGVALQSTAEIERYFASENQANESIAKRIVASGVNVLIVRKGIDDPIQHALARAGVMVVRRIPLEMLETIARATQATIVPDASSLQGALGEAARVHVDTRLEATIIEGTPQPSSTILLRGSTDHVAQELERATHDALGVVRSALRSGYVLPGGLVLESSVAGMRGDEVRRAVADSFAQIARYILRSAGIESLPSPGTGIDTRSGERIDKDTAIIEPVEVKRSAIASAFEIVRTIIRVETIVTLPDPRRNRT